MTQYLYRQVGVVTVLISMVASLFPTHFAASAILEPGFELETVASGFTLPTATAFSQDGRIFVAEKAGTVRVIENGVLLPDPVITLTDVNNFADRGLIGIATDPDFISNGYLYLSYTYENTPGANLGGPKTGRIVRVTVVGNTASEASKVVLVGSIGGNSATPSCEDYLTTDDCIPSDAPSHSVGGLRFGPDGKLYATTGDGANFDYADIRSLRAQDIDSLAGKVLRINPDGTAPSDNPFYDGDPNSNRSKVFALGVRNSFRLNFHPTTGALFAGDVGWSDWEEVNHIVSGANYGWPCIEGPDFTEHNCTPSSAPTAPMYAYPHNSAGAGSVTVGAFPANSAYPAEYDNTLFLGDYAQNWIKLLDIDGANTVTAVRDFDNSPNGPVDISTGPDGYVYYLAIYTGQLMRLTHTDGNRHPVPQVAANPTSGLAPLIVQFSSVGSLDPDGDAFTYLWQFGDGTTSTDANPLHQYSSDGTYISVLTLTDSYGSSASESVVITVGNQAPVPSIDQPASGALYEADQIIQLVGSGTDLEDGVLDASAFHWDVILHHNTHTHVITTFDGVTNPSFVAPDHNSSDVYVEVVFTVTDSGGLTGARSINLYLNNGTASGNLVTNPSFEIVDSGSGNPLGWFMGWYGDLDPVFTYPVAGFDGASAVKLDVNRYVAGSAKWYFDPAFVTPGEEYLFSNQYTSDVTTHQVAQFGFADGTYQYTYLGALPPAAVATPVEQMISVPANAKTLTVFHEIASVGSLTVDDYSLTLDQVQDTEGPTVSVSAPLNGDVVSGDGTVVAIAEDGSGVAGLTLMVDGVDVGVEDTTSPYVFTWDTTAVSDGAHVVTVRARDELGNVSTASPVTVMVSNTAAPTNLVLNGGLETVDGNNPLGWLASSWGNHQATFTYPVSGNGGGKAVRTEITSYLPVPNGTGDSKWYFTKVPVTPGIEYTYSDFYRSNTVSDIIGQYTLSDGSYHYFGLVKEIQPSADWQQVSGMFVPPVNATDVTFFHLISSIGYVEIDDIELYEDGSGLPSETNPPVVTFTNPLEGQTVSGDVTLTVDSYDDTEVTYIFYAVDGVPVTGQITTAPYAFVWDTTTVSDGVHYLKATTHDPFGNNSTDTIAVTVDNTNPPAANLVPNASLETAGGNGDPESWFRGGWGTNDRTYTYPVAGVDGAKAARIEMTSYTNGDAKWYFADVPVTGGEFFTLSDQYRSNVPTNITLRFTLASGATQYVGLGVFDPAATWATVNQTFVAPADAVSVTVLHILYSVGWLEVDDYTLISGNDNEFAQGMISYTFDDGWISQYTEAFPILEAADVDGTFYIISQETANATPAQLIDNPSLEVDGGNGDPESWFRGGWGTNDRTYTYPVAGIDGDRAAKVEITNYTNGDAKWYFADVPVIPGQRYDISDRYNSNVASQVLMRYLLSDGSYQYVYLTELPSTGGVWQNFSQTVIAPTDAVSATVFHVIFGVGSLTVDDYSFVGEQVFLDTSQMLEIQAAGHEIGAHSQTHPSLTNIPTSDAQAEIEGSLADLLGMGASPVASFAYPYGDYNASVEGFTLGAGFASGRGVDRGYNTRSTDKFALKIQQVDRTTTIADIQAWTAQAEADNTWLILMFHQVNDDLAQDLGVTAQFLQEIVNHVSTTGLNTVTVGEGVTFMNP